MTFFDFFKPKWKHSKWEIRRKAIEPLKDERILIKIARNDDYPEVRASAIKKVRDYSVLADILKNDKDISIQQSAIEALRTLLKEGDSHVRLKARKTLVEIKDPIAIESLIYTMDRFPDFFGESKAEINEAARALVKIGEPVVEPLITTWKERKFNFPWTLVHAAKVLGDIRDKRAVEILKPALKDGTNFLREEAARALGKIGDKQAVESLISALKDNCSEVRQCSAEALGKIRDKSAIEPLMEIIKSDNDVAVRSAAVLALGRIGDEIAIHPPISMMNDKNDKIRCIATESLILIKDARTIKPLVDTLKDSNPNVRLLGLIGLSIKMIDKYGNKDDSEMLIAGLKTNLPYIYGAAVVALTKCNIRDNNDLHHVIQLIITALQKKDMQSYVDVAQSVGNIVW